MYFGINCLGGHLKSLEAQAHSLTVSGSWGAGLDQKIERWRAANSKLKCELSMKANDAFGVNCLGGYFESLEAQAHSLTISGS